ASARAQGALLRSLADEDPEVVAFSAYGLGSACREKEAEIVRALTLRAASLLSTKHAISSTTLDPVTAIADALARCGSADAERSLRAWLNAERALAESAALALGQIASRKGRLDDSSLVALLDAASRPDAPIEHALFAFTRLSGLGPPVQTRLLEVARQALTGSGVRRSLALRALASAGDEAAVTLGEAVKNRDLEVAERAEAARSLGRMNEPGQKALRALLAALPTAPSASEHGIWIAVLEALRPPIRDMAEPLGALAESPLSDAPAERRRAVALRCRAAALLAGRSTLSPRLRACDPDPEGRQGKLATLTVLDQGKLEGPRLTRFRELVAAPDAVVRQRALNLLGGHPETEGAAALLAQALRSKTTGDVATAAGVLARYPERAGSEGTPHPDVIAALGSAFDATDKTFELETRGALMDAAAALQLLGFKSRLEKSCSSDLPSLREHAERAIRLLGDKHRTCGEFQPAAAGPDELGRLLSTPAVLELELDSGAALKLNLDPELTPVAVTHVVELARSGFYDGMAIHRVVPGFVAQFGDRLGDGFGSSGGPPLRCETAPLPFPELGVGMALGGRDTGSSQIFVALGRFPHLDGEYSLIGRAEGPWNDVAEGDVIRKVRVNAGK
ncbi:MAG TPA: peptidylprolyl isomerase, partial [Polyangiaceae bacterium]|nr:peptidylprolyl isomerase [Polyangiaceae bacterium]